MEMDQLHEPFRAQLVPELGEIRQVLSRVDGVYGTYLSGAGPTIMTLVQATASDQIVEAISQLNLDAQIKTLDFASDGVIVENM